KSWTGALAIILAAGTAWAQDPYLPVGQGKPAMMPEPIPFGTSSPAPAAAPGLAPSFGAPTPGFGGPAPRMPCGSPSSSCDNSLPSDGANAWCDCFCPPCACYLEIGYLALRRQDPGFRTVAVLDTQSGGIDTGNVPNFLLTPRFADFHDIDPE